MRPTKSFNEISLLATLNYKGKRMRVLHTSFVFLLALGLLFIGSPTGMASHLTGTSATYTLDVDFDDGTSINLSQVPADQLQLDNTTSAFNFIWVAASGRGTIVKIDTQTGAVLGEYWSAPNGRGRNPSRTTVDANGNVWAGNRDESSEGGSVVHVGLEENGQCVDRNNNGVIDTSTGLGDIRAWGNAGDVDSNGGVSTAVDECLIHYTRTIGTGVRTMAVDGNNDLWAGGHIHKTHELIDGASGIPTGVSFNVDAGGYGGLIDANGILWSANWPATKVLRYDTNTNTSTLVGLNGKYSYGMGIDSNGYIWQSHLIVDGITKVSPDGLSATTYPTTGGADGDRGVAVSLADDNIWVASSQGSDVGRLNSNGVLLATINLNVNPGFDGVLGGGDDNQPGNFPTGISVDAVGKVWVTTWGGFGNVMRIDPTANAVDLVVDIQGAGKFGRAYPYNYSDMTGSTLTAAPPSGTWTLIHDSGVVGQEWGKITWTSDEPGDSSIVVSAASSANAGGPFSVVETVSSGGDLTVPDGQYLRVTVSFVRSTTDADDDGTNDSPILFDLTISTTEPPDCSAAAPSVSTIWPPNHKFVPVEIWGITDADGDPIAITVDSIWQDEPVNTEGDGNAEPDGIGTGTSVAQVRAERSGTKKVPGDGRVYHIGFTASDGNETCTGTVSVGVPHDVKDTPIDGGALYDSTLVPTVISSASAQMEPNSSFELYLPILNQNQ